MSSLPSLPLPPVFPSFSSSSPLPSLEKEKTVFLSVSFDTIKGDACLRPMNSNGLQLLCDVEILLQRSDEEKGTDETAKSKDMIHRKESISMKSLRLEMTNTLEFHANHNANMTMTMKKCVLKENLFHNLVGPVDVYPSSSFSLSFPPNQPHHFVNLQTKPLVENTTSLSTVCPHYHQNTSFRVNGVYLITFVGLIMWMWLWRHIAAMAKRISSGFEEDGNGIITGNRLIMARPDRFAFVPKYKCAIKDYHDEYQITLKKLSEWEKKRMEHQESLHMGNERKACFQLRTYHRN